MFILPGSWELASLLAKLLLYIGAFSIAGGSLCAWRYSNADRSALASNFLYIFFGTVVGFHGAILGFLVQVGLISNSGLVGMFDWGMISILMDTSLGDVTLYRLVAFMLAGVVSLVCLKRLQDSSFSLSSPIIRLLLALQVVALLGLAYSLRVAGHVSVLGVVAQTAITLHFVAFALWIGSCFPFLQLTRILEVETLQRSLRQFGRDAIGILLVLVVAGVLMLFDLLGSVGELVSTAYGLALLAKFLLVLVILGIAAMNKLVLVPGLMGDAGIARLQTSLRYEIVIAMLILMVTAYLATIVGPADHSM